MAITNLKVPVSEPNKTILKMFKEFLEDEYETEMYISGAGGTGKTEQLAHLVAWCEANDIPYIVGAYTNQACKVLANRIYKPNFVDQAPVKTIWSFLRKIPGVNDEAKHTNHVTIERKIGDPEIVKVIFFDEYSMISEKDYFDIGEIQQDEEGNIVTRLVYLGDELQLPPVNSPRSIRPRGDYQITLSHNYRADKCIEPVLQTLREMSVTKKITKLPEVPCVHRKSDIIPEFVLRHQQGHRCLMLAYTNKKVDVLNKLIHEHITGQPMAEILQDGTKIVVGKRPIIKKTYTGEFWLDLLKHSAYLAEDENNMPELHLLHNNAKDTLSPLNDTYNTLSTLQQLADEYDITPLLVVDTPSKSVAKLGVYGYAEFNEIMAELREVAVGINNRIVEKYKCKSVGKYCKENDIPEKAERGRAWARYLSFNNFVQPYSLPYASTVHKAQGSTVEYVFIDGKDMLKLYQHNPQEYISLFYTAVSRARHEVFINN